MANNGNLKRGTIQPPKPKGPGTPFGDPEGKAGLAAIQEVREREAELRSAENPDDIILAMMREASIAATKGLRKFNRKGGEPSRMVIEATKEARQLATVAADILRARGAATEAERFFAEVASRISAANLGEGPQPVGEVSLA